MKKGKVGSIKIDKIFGFSDKIKMEFSHFELMAIKECIEKVIDKGLYGSFMLENNAYNALEKIIKKLGKTKDRIEPLRQKEK